MMEDSFIWNGDDFGSLGVIVTAHAEAGMPAPKLHLQEFGQAHGSVAQGQFVQARRESWKCLLHASSDAALRGARNAVMGKLAPAFGVRSLQPNHDPDIQMFARVASVVTLDYSGAHGWEFDIDWIIPDPFRYALEVSSQSRALSGSSTIFSPTGAGNIVQGTASAHPDITVRNTGVGEVSTITIANVTTGRSVTWTDDNTPLVQNHYLRFSVSEDHVERSSNGTSWVTAMKGLSPLSDARNLYLQNGVRNQLTVTGISTGTISITYTARYY